MPFHKMRRLLPSFFLLLCFACSAGARAPNIVFILADDLDQDIFNLSPRLDALMVQKGVAFDNHFVSLSLCCPSRVATLRGQFAHNSGIFTNRPPNGGFDKVFTDGLENTTVATSLQAAGYRTALFGKYLNGYPTLASGLNYVPPGWTEWASPNAGDPYGEYNYSLNVNGVTVNYGAKSADYMVDVLSHIATDFIRRSVARDPEQPFFAYVAPYAPHIPATPPKRYEHVFNDLSAPRGPSFNEADVSDKPTWLAHRHLLNQKAINAIDALYRDRRRSMLAVEDLVADILTTLQELGQSSNTYVFFTSDNGFHMGQHRLDSGKNTEFEEDLRIPLVVVGPGVPAGRSVSRLTANVDYAGTFAELAGIADLPFVDGRSLVPFLKGQEVANWRDALLIEHAADFNAAALTRNRLLEPPDPGDVSGKNRRTDHAPFIGLRTADGRTYVEYHNGDREFYDLALDPFELVNTYPALPTDQRALLSGWAHSLSNAAGQALRDAERSPGGLAGAQGKATRAATD